MMHALLLWLAACQPTSAPGAAGQLSPAEQLTRASLSLRGMGPRAEELAFITAHPDALAEAVSVYAESDAFLDVVADLHAERWLTRIDARPTLPAAGVLGGVERTWVASALAEAPLNLVMAVVAEDRPYTDILTTEETRVDEVLALLYGLPYDTEGPSWQWSTYQDGRPTAGVLSGNGLWFRHISANTNKHRARAAFFADAFLCEDLAGRDVSVVGELDLTDPAQVASAVSGDPACVACHQTLDPLAALFSGFRRYVLGSEVTAAMENGCEGETADLCYPLGFYNVGQERAWARDGLRPPGYFGLPAADLTELGERVAQDRRFATCTVRNLVSYFGQVEREAVPRAWVDELADDFVSGGFDLRQLAADIVLSPAFVASGTGVGSAFVVPALTMRPSQFARTVEDRTGFTWTVDGSSEGCADAPGGCWGTVDLMRSDRFGFRMLAGGVDGYDVMWPVHTPTPGKLLVLREFAAEAAHELVESDFGRPPEQRVLLGEVERTTTREEAVRSQLVQLHRVILGETLHPDSLELVATLGLFTLARGQREDATEAWKVVVAALFQDPLMVLY
jgi:hypothetical protein